MELHHFRGSHFEVGLAIGKTFKSQIQKTLTTNTVLQNRFLPFHRTEEGKQRYNTLLKLHSEKFPDYVTELEGIAQGAGVSFDELLVANMGDNYENYVPQPDGSGCSSCSLITPEIAVFGHSEDNWPMYKDQMYLARMEITGKPSLTALCYPGYLPGRALGFNSQGICFCANSVGPKKICTGMGRHFVTRSIFEARSLDEAIQLAAGPEHASGVNLTIGSLKERRIVDLEISPDDHHLLEIKGQYFHANHYIRLSQTDQLISPSSRSRQIRGDELLAEGTLRDKQSLLSILRDQKKRDYPILRDGQPPDVKGYTLFIGFFDLDLQKLAIYPGVLGKDEKFEPLIEISMKE